MTQDLSDKKTRKALIGRYLDAATTPYEEQCLREWFARHEADADEQEFALLVGLAAPCASCLPELDWTETEFDRIVGSRGEAIRRIPRRGRGLRWSAGLAAAAAGIALFFFLRPASKPEPPLSPLVIAQGIQQIMLLSPYDIESVEARPAGSKAILTARLKDGRNLSYILTYDEDSGTTSFLACQSSPKHEKQ